MIFLLAMAHSFLGERFILRRLFRRGNLPHLFGGEDFTRRTLRFGWHLTTVLMWGSAGILWLLAGGGNGAAATEQGETLVVIPRLIALMYLGCALASAIGVRLRHFSVWIFLMSAGLVWLGAR